MTSPLILLVEDDPHDVFMVQTVFESTSPDVLLVPVQDADAAQAYLAGDPPYTDRARHPLPDLVLLDLKLPGASGHDVLHWMRARPGLMDLPVFVLSSSRDPDDVERAYSAGANGYLRKVGAVTELEALARGIETYLTMRRDRGPSDAP